MPLILVGLMENVCGVTRHLRAKILAEGGDPARETLNVIPTLSRSICYLDADGGAWRAYDFVEDTICLQQVGSETDFRTGANGCAEDEPDQSKVHFDLHLYEVFAKGYLSTAGASMSMAEKKSLAWGARLMTLGASRTMSITKPSRNKSLQERTTRRGRLLTYSGAHPVFYYASSFSARSIRYPTPTWVWIRCGASGHRSSFLRREAI